MTVSVHEWGVRLSDVLKKHLTDASGPRFDEAHILAVNGDGLTQSLAKEYTFMVRGLGVTIGVLLKLLQETDTRFSNEEATSDLQNLLFKFRTDLSNFNLSNRVFIKKIDEEFSLTLDILNDILEWFVLVQKRLAAEIIIAIDKHDDEHALALIEAKETGQYLLLHDCLVGFMADSFSWVLRYFGEEELLQFHLNTAEGQKTGFERWEKLSPEEFAKTTAFLLKQHMGKVAVSEDNEKFIVTQSPCGSGGRFNLDGAYDGTEELPLIKTPGPLTFGKPQIPVYCSHCAIWNGAAPLRWCGHPQWVFDRPAQEDGSCVMHIYKDPQNVPEDYSERVAVSEDD